MKLSASRNRRLKIFQLKLSKFSFKFILPRLRIQMSIVPLRNNASR